MHAALLGRVSAGEHLSFEDMAQAIDAMLAGSWSEAEIGLFLVALRAKGETADEVAGAAMAMRRHMTPIRSSRRGLVDTCGTGGNASTTFNVSTTAALVTAAAGVPVAKHGNRRVTSRSGSADVLRELGVQVEADVATVERCLDELGICFCFAPLLHGAMRAVAAVRQRLGMATIFNLLGPLANPAGATRQLMGVGRPETQQLLAEALARLGTERAFVVHGSDGLGELTITGPSRVWEVGTRVGPAREFTFSPEEFGLEPGSLAAVEVDSPAASAAVVRRVLAGERGPAREIVLLNAAAALLVADAEPTPPAAARRAAEALDSGAARELLARLAALSHGTSSP